MNAALRTRLLTGVIWCVEALAALLAIVTVLAGLLAWSLSRGPISLTRWAPSVETALGRALPGHRVRFETADLLWNGETRELMVRLGRAEIESGEGSRVAEIPVAELAFSARAAALGRLRLEHVVLRGASLEIARRTGGGFALGFGPGEADAGQKGNQRPAVAPLVAGLGRLLNSFTQGKRPLALSYFESLRLADGRLIMEDRRTGRRWQAREANLLVRAQGPRADLTFDARVELGGEPLSINGEGDLRPGDGGKALGGLALRFQALDPARLARLAPELAGLRRLSAPLSGVFRVDPQPFGIEPEVRLEVDAGPGQLDLGLRDIEPLPFLGARLEGVVEAGDRRLRVDRFTFDAAGSSGVLSGAIRAPSGKAPWQFELVGEPLSILVPIYSEKPAEIDRLTLDGRYSPETGALQVETADLRAGDAQLTLTADIQPAEGRSPEIHARGEVRDFPVDLLWSYWPMGKALGARDWIQKNVDGGRIGAGSLRIDAPAGGFDGGFIPNEMLRFAFSLEDARVRYVPGLTPMQVPKADAVLEGNRFEMVAREARIGRSIVVHDARMETGNFHIKGSPGVFYAKASGETSEMVGLLDMGPFGYPSRYGFNPALLGGQGEVSLEVSLPLRRNITIDQIAFGAVGRVRNFALPALLPGIGLGGGDITISVGQKGLEGKGRAELNDIPVELEWYETFRGGGASPSRYVLAAEIGEAERATLGLSGIDAVTGPVQISLDIRGKGKTVAEARLDADLTKAGIRLEEFGWTKPAGAQTLGRAVLATPSGGGYELREARLLGAGADISGSVELAGDGRLLSAQFPRMKLGALTDLTLSAERDGDGGLAVSVTGSRLNARPFLGQLTFEAGKISQGGRPVQVTGRVGQVALRNGIVLSEARLDFTHDGTEARTLLLEGQFPEDAALAIRLEPAGGGERTISMVAEDAGSLVKGVYGYGSLIGGRAEITARMAPDGTAEGHFGAEDFNLADLPLLAKLLSVASLTGIGDVLSGEGLSFRGLDAPFRLSPESLHVDGARMWGPTIGLTLDGRVDRAGAGKNELNGTIVPLYGLNSALGEIPLLGPLLTSREGEGVFAMTYAIKGSLADPRIVVNPLSALAPGMLRRVFEGGEEGELSDEGSPSAGSDE